MSVAVGMFGVAEILRNLEHRGERTVVASAVSGLMLTRDDLRRIAGPVLRGTALGSALGVLPGAGHVLASFASYTVEKKVSKEPGRFGTAPSRVWQARSLRTMPLPRRRSSRF